MSDAWEEIQAVKSKRNSLREKLEKRKKERQHILNTSLGCDVKSEGSPSSLKQERGVSSPGSTKDESTPTQISVTATPSKKLMPTVSLERRLLQVLSDLQLQLPATAKDLLPGLGDVDDGIVANLLQKFATQKLIVIKERSRMPGTAPSYSSIEVVGAESVRLAAVLAALEEDIAPAADPIVNRKRRGKGEDDSEDVSSSKQSKLSTDDKKSFNKDETDIMSLLAMPSSREKAVKRVGEEIMDLLSKPTAKERSLADKFKSQGGAQVMEFCPHGTRAECLRNHNVQKQMPAVNSGSIDSTSNAQSHAAKDNREPSAGKEQVSGVTDQSHIDEEDGYLCKKLHFKKIIQVHTDESLGDCSFLNTCFHMDTCKYVHYEVDNSDPNVAASNKIVAEPMQKNSHNGNTSTNSSSSPGSGVLTLHPPQWVQCDLRYLDMAFLGKFAVIMADPPWDIHMELPYGTMSDDEMRRLGVPQLQDNGLIFLWVTGRAMELGRECLKLWGYARVDELIWVKTNQLQRIIRTGRTGHWLNHGKEHCLVGMKGNPPNLNRGLDCDVIVAEVRATSHKPDEIYGIIERLSPGTRKIELFGRPHNVQPNWITLGNQVDGVRLVDPELIAAFRKRYPDGNCMAPPPEIA